MILFLDGVKEVNPPMEYLEMLYRKEFKLTPQEFDKIPFKTFLLDMRMTSIAKEMEGKAK